MRNLVRSAIVAGMLLLVSAVPMTGASGADTAPTFTDRYAWPTEALNSHGFIGTYQWDVADLDGDGHDDVLAGGYCGSFKGILWGTGSTTLEVHTLQSDRDYCWYGAQAADIDGDGDLDFVALDRCQQSGSSVYVNEGDRTFTQMAGGPTCVNQVGDYEGDGDTDLLHNGYFSLNDGAGAFSDAISTGTGNYGTAVRVADLNADGFLDVVAPYRQCCGTYWNKIALSNGDGSYSISHVGYGGNYGEIADVDGDGDIDFLSLDWPWNGAKLWLNDGEGAFTLGQSFSSGGAGAAIGDVDGDGNVEIMIGNHDQQIMEADGDGTFQASGPGLGGDTPYFADVNGDGLHDLLSVRGFRVQFVDFDGDGIPDHEDTDDDNDGVPDDQDAFPYDSTEWADNDGDGTGDNADPDDDNDGTLDGDDAFPFDPTETSDNDGDGIGDNADPDDDNDGVADGDDAFPFDGTEWGDNDSDGIGDNADPDDDNDGIEDDLDPDSDGDGNIDCTPSFDDIDCLLATVTAAIGVFIEY